MATMEATVEATQEATMDATQGATMEAAQQATMEATQEASEESKRVVAVFNKEEELKRVEFLKDNELLHSKRFIDYKDPNKREAVLDKFCTENKMDVRDGSRARGKCMARLYI